MLPDTPANLASDAIRETLSLRAKLRTLWACRTLTDQQRKAVYAALASSTNLMRSLEALGEALHPKEGANAPQ